MPRHGYTDYTIPLKLLRDALRKAMHDHPRFSHEQLIDYGVKTILGKGGLFDEHADGFKGYIVTNALGQAEGDERAAGYNPVNGAARSALVKKHTPTRRDIAKEKAVAKKEAKAFLIEQGPRMLLNMPTPFGKPVKDLTGQEARALGGIIGELFSAVGDSERLPGSFEQVKVLWAKIKT